MPQRPFLPFADYQRIYQVVYSVLEASEVATTHRACIFFASVGACILRDVYGLKPTICAGTMALMVDDPSATVMVYGREDDGVWVYDEDGFHAWVECDGWLIDFMAPIMGVGFMEDGAKIKVPYRMLQKPIIERKPTLAAIQREGDFFYERSPSVAKAVIESQRPEFGDLLNVCLSWYRKPPKSLLPMKLGGTDLSEPMLLQLKAPTITGVW